jgi:hypothetical protein
MNDREVIQAAARIHNTARKQLLVLAGAAAILVAVIVVGLFLLFQQQRTIAEGQETRTEITERLDDLTRKMRRDQRRHSRQSARDNDVILKTLRKLARQAGLDVSDIPRSVRPPPSDP